MNNFDLGEMRELAHKLLRQGKTVPQVRLALAEAFEKYSFQVMKDGSVFATPDDGNFVHGTRVF